MKYNANRGAWHSLHVCDRTASSYFIFLHVYSPALLVRAFFSFFLFTLWTNRCHSSIIGVFPSSPPRYHIHHTCLYFIRQRVQYSHFLALFMLVVLHQISPTRTLVLFGYSTNLQDRPQWVVWWASASHFYFSHPLEDEKKRGITWPTTEPQGT